MKNIHWYYKFLIVFLLLFSMFFLFNENISNFVNQSSLKGYLSAIFIPVSSIKRNVVLDYKKTVKENNKLKKDLLINSALEEQNKNLKEEIEKLKKVLKLEKSYTGYNTIVARTIIRNKMYWYNTITIDKGSDDGIEPGFAVIGIDGLIGIISNTTRNSSTVKLITNNDTNYRVSGMIKKNNDTVVGLIEGYEYPYIKVSLIDSFKKVKINDKFYSYGLENFPRNIYIGEVKKIEKDSYELSTIVYIKPKQDMNNIDYVVVLGNS